MVEEQPAGPAPPVCNSVSSLWRYGLRNPRRLRPLLRPRQPRILQLKSPNSQPKLAQQQSRALDTVWTLITAFLVFWMNAGFALVESGMCRVKNAVNILSKNFVVFALSSLAFFVVGWGVMFGDGNGFMGLNGLC